MQQRINNNTHSLINKPSSMTAMGLLNNKMLASLKMVTFMFALSAFPMQSYADKALNYGDINDEDGKYVSAQVDLKNVEKVSHKTKAPTSNQKLKLKTKTKQVSETDLDDSSRVGYGDLDQAED